MTHRFEITCPHCRRSYALRSDPSNLAQTSAKVRCGRCRKRFRLSAAISVASASEGEAPRSQRNSYRKRISRPEMPKAVPPTPAAESEEAPAKMVDDMALAFERALKERREAAPSTKPQKRKTPVLAYRVTPPPTAHDILLQARANRAARAEAKRQQLAAASLTDADVVDAMLDAALDVGGDEPDTHVEAAPDPVPVSEPAPEPVSTHEVGTRSSRPPRPRDIRGTLPPRLQVTAKQNAALRQAWISHVDPSLESLRPPRTASVAALEWLLAEDALRV